MGKGQIATVILPHEQFQCFLSGLKSLQFRAKYHCNRISLFSLHATTEKKAKQLHLAFMIKDIFQPQLAGVCGFKR